MFKIYIYKGLKGKPSANEECRPITHLLTEGREVGGEEGET